MSSLIDESVVIGL